MFYVTTETAQHLFFCCDYSNAVWQGLLLKQLQIFKQVQVWDEEVRWISQRCRRTDARSRLVVMCFSEAIHAIWLQRNAIVFGGICKSTDQLLREILFKVSCRCDEALRTVLYALVVFFSLPCCCI